MPAPGFVPPASVVPSPSAVPHRQDEEDQKQNPRDPRARDRWPRHRRALLNVMANVVTVPDFPEPNQNQNKRPIAKKNRPWVQVGNDSPEQQHAAKHDQNNRPYKRMMS